MLRHLAPWLPLDGVQLVFLFSLRALGDQVWAGAISIFSFFAIMGGVGWWSATHGGGPTALVDGLIWGMIAAALLQGGRFVWRARTAGKAAATLKAPSRPALEA